MHLLSAINLEIDTNNQESKKTKKRFSEEEDSIILEFVQNFGAHTWGRILPLLPGRTSRQVRERYVNYLSPNVNRAPWTEEEDALIMQLVSKYGKKWSYISQSFNKRTDVSIKNRYILLKRKEQKANSNLSKNNTSQQNIQLQPNLFPLVGSHQALESQSFESEIATKYSHETQQPVDFVANDVINDQNYFDILDLGNDYPINDDNINIFDFQIFE